MIETGREIDKRYAWPFGRAEWLARRGKLPHLLLPDGAIRFEPEAVASMIRRMPEPASKHEVTPC